MIKKLSSLFSVLLLADYALMAQASTGTSAGLQDIPSEYLIAFLLIVLFFMAAVIVVLVNWIFSLLKQIEQGDRKEEGEVETVVEEDDAISKLIKQVTVSLTDAVPVEREKEIEFAHEYDGIRELDNSLPPWWKYMFYLTIIFAFIYMYRYHIAGTAPLSEEEYKQEMALAAIQKEA